MAKEAMKDFQTIVSRILDLVEAHADTARREKQAITLGPARLIVKGPTETAQSADAYGNGWTILAEAAFHLRATINRVSYADPPSYIFQTTFVFAKNQKDPDFRWREMSFFAPLHAFR